jgi:hypothetical protein
VVDTFNQEIPADTFGARLTDKLAVLGAAIDQFRALLAGHEDFTRRIDRRDENARSRMLSHVPEDWRKAGAQRRDDRDVDALTGMSTVDKAELREHYRLLRGIHAEGIGDRSTRGGLYVGLKEAREEGAAVRERVGRQGLSRWAYFGHTLALVFGVIGLAFLARFVVLIAQCGWPLWS